MVALTSIDQLTPEWLTERLQGDGFLFAGNVVSILQRSNRSTMFARVWRLQIEYSSNTSMSAPRKLFVKLSRHDREANAREVGFYSRIAPSMLRPSVPRCYAATHSEPESAYHLILEDLSDSHRTLAYTLPPTRQEAEQVVDTIASFHGFWWNHPRLGHDIGEAPSPEKLEAHVQKLASAFPRLADFLGDRMTRRQRDLYEWAFSNYSRLMMRRYQRGENLTLIHGDAHAWNFMFPRESETGSVYMVDWYTHHNIWRCSMGVADLASLIVPWWSIERRQELELDLLRRYHNRVREIGVSNYEWDDVWDDYRLAAIRFLFDPITEFGRTAVSRWLPWFERTTSALADLRCSDL